jgi:hypothetical protein
LGVALSYLSEANEQHGPGVIFMAESPDSSPRSARLLFSMNPGFVSQAFLLICQKIPGICHSGLDPESSRKPKK